MALIAVHAVIDIIWIAAVRLGQLRLVRMAARALKNCVVVWIRMTGGTHSVCVAMIHREPGVAERCAGPSRGVVAGRAGCCENGWRGLMDRIRRSSIIRRVAAVTICRKSRVVVVYMTTGACHLYVETCQRKTGCAVVEFSVGPHGGVMAEIAGSGKPDLNMVNRGGRGVVILQVA